MTATVTNLQPTPGTRAHSYARVNAVMSVYNDLYDAREENSTERRKLETHEALFLSAVESIHRTTNKTLSDGLKTWGDGAAYDALCNLTYRDQAEKMEAALANYKAICEELEELDGCQCAACIANGPHSSSCAVHNEPALPAGPCDCEPFPSQAWHGG